MQANRRRFNRVVAAVNQDLGKGATFADKLAAITKRLGPHAPVPAQLAAQLFLAAARPRSRRHRETVH